MTQETINPSEYSALQESLNDALSAFEANNMDGARRILDDLATKHTKTIEVIVQSMLVSGVDVNQVQKYEAMIDALYANPADVDELIESEPNNLDDPKSWTYEQWYQYLEDLDLMGQALGEADFIRLATAFQLADKTQWPLDYRKGIAEMLKAIREKLKPVKPEEKKDEPPKKGIEFPQVDYDSLSQKTTDLVNQTSDIKVKNDRSGDALVGSIQSLQTEITSLISRLQVSEDIIRNQPNGDSMQEKINAVEKITILVTAAQKAIENSNTEIADYQRRMKEIEDKDEYDAWKAKAELVNLIAAIDSVLSGVIVDNPGINVWPMDPSGFVETSLVTMRTDLNNKRTTAQNAGLLNRVPTNQSIENDLDELIGSSGSGGRYADAEARIRRAIEITHEDTPEEKARKRIDELWDTIDENFYAFINASSSNTVSEAHEEIKGLQEHLTPEERDLLKIAVEFRDATYHAAGNAHTQHLGWQDLNKARGEIVPLLNVSNLQKFRRFGEFTRTDADGNIYRLRLERIITKIHDEYFNGKYEFQPSRYWNYAASGNPSEKDRADGVPTIQELVIRDFPDIMHFPVFIRSSILNFILLSEMRTDQYIREYAQYQGSPIPGFDAIAADDAAPLAAVAYKAQAGASMPIHRVMAMVTRFPKTMGPGASQYRMVDRHVARKRRFFSDMAPFLKTVEDPEVTFGNNKDTANLDTMLAVRNKMMWMTFPTGLPFVELSTDLKIKPTLWDWVDGEWLGEPLPKINYFDFKTLEEAFRDFEKFVDDGFRNIDSVETVDTAVSSLVDKIKYFKAMLILMEGNAHQELLSIVQLMSIVYLKKLYVRYKSLEKESYKSDKASTLKKVSPERVKFARAKFAKLVKEVMENSKTLPKAVYSGGKFPLEKFLNSLGSILPNEWTARFDDEQFSASVELQSRLKDFWASGFDRVFESWMREPTLPDKDPNDGQKSKH